MVRSTRSKTSGGYSNHLLRKASTANHPESSRPKRSCVVFNHSVYIDSTSRDDSQSPTSNPDPAQDYTQLDPNLDPNLDSNLDSTNPGYSLRNRARPNYTYPDPEGASSHRKSSKGHRRESKESRMKSSRPTSLRSLVNITDPTSSPSPSPNQPLTSNTRQYSSRKPSSPSPECSTSDSSRQLRGPRTRYSRRSRTIYKKRPHRQYSEDASSSDEKEDSHPLELDEGEEGGRYPKRGRTVSYAQFYKTTIYSAPVLTRKKGSRQEEGGNGKYNLRERSKAVLDRIRYFSTNYWAKDPEPISEDERPIRRSAVRANGANDDDISDDGQSLPILPINISQVHPSRSHITLPTSTPVTSCPPLPSLEDIGGLKDQIRVVKEALFLPNYYPDICNQLGITPTRGILFHGPPGTGKTLMAQALLNECSHCTNPIAFFHIHASDILSKWVGKSESKIQEIFRTARLWQPSVIYIDEIDGLVPCRSSTDRHNASLVGALLSQMDGLELGGNVLVLGSTNRIHAIDPALRRAGRFELDLYFPIPDRDSRLSILTMITRSWVQPPTADFLGDLATRTYGFSGADLASLCSKAARRAISRYLKSDPQSTSEVQEEDFNIVLEGITPTSAKQHRMDIRPLPDSFSEYSPRVNRAVDLILNSHSGSTTVPLSLPTVTLVFGQNGVINHYITNAILYGLDNFAVSTIDLAKLSELAEISDVTALDSLLQQASRSTLRKVVVLRHLDTFLEVAGTDLLHRLRSALLTPYPPQQWTFLFTSTTLTPSLNLLLNNLKVYSFNTDPSC